MTTASDVRSRFTSRGDFDKSIPVTVSLRGLKNDLSTYTDNIMLTLYVNRLTHNIMLAECGNDGLMAATKAVKFYDVIREYGVFKFRQGSKYLCPSCFSAVTGEHICPNCGTLVDSSRSFLKNTLSPYAEGDRRVSFVVYCNKAGYEAFKLITQFKFIVRERGGFSLHPAVLRHFTSEGRGWRFSAIANLSLFNKTVSNIDILSPFGVVHVSKEMIEFFNEHNDKMIEMMECTDGYICLDDKIRNEARNSYIIAHGAERLVDTIFCNGSRDLSEEAFTAALPVFIERGVIGVTYSGDVTVDVDEIVKNITLDELKDISKYGDYEPQLSPRIISAYGG